MYFFLLGENCDIWMQFFVCMLLPKHLAIEHTGLYRYDLIIIKNIILKYQDDRVDQHMTVEAAVFQQFEPVTFCHLSDIVKQLRPTNCPLDSIPARLVKECF